MAKFKLMTGKEKGKAKLYTEIQRGGLRLMVNTGIVVTVEEWKKSQKSQSAYTKYQATPEGGEGFRSDRESVSGDRPSIQGGKNQVKG